MVNASYDTINRPQAGHFPKQEVTQPLGAFCIGGKMREIPLTQGWVALIDDEDYASVSRHKWCAEMRKHTCYARTMVCLNGKRQVLRMHSLIIKNMSKMDVDHINGDGLDNRRQNLRISSRTQNNANSRKRQNCSSLFKGVSWDSNRRKWYVQICLNQKHHRLGRFINEREAAKAYDRAAINYFGEFARLNFPDFFDDTAVQKALAAKTDKEEN